MLSELLIKIFKVGDLELNKTPKPKKKATCIRCKSVFEPTRFRTVLCETCNPDKK